MSRDWQTDSEEFADRMMDKIIATARLTDTSEVEVVMSKEMVSETLAEMGVCERCGLKRECECPATDTEADR